MSLEADGYMKIERFTPSSNFVQILMYDQINVYYVWSRSILGLLMDSSNMKSAHIDDRIECVWEDGIAKEFHSIFFNSFLLVYNSTVG